jgi:adenylosuccinate lyase
MLSLVESGLPRQEAYVMVQRNALAALDGQGEFRALLEADPEVSARLGPEGIAAAFDLAHHLRHVPFILERAGLGGDEP